MFNLKQVLNGSVVYETHGTLDPSHLSIVECPTLTACIDGPDPSPVPLLASAVLLLAALGGLAALHRRAA